MGNGRQHSKTVKQGSGIFLALCAMGAKQAGGFPYRGSGSAKDLQGTLKGSVAKGIQWRNGTALTLAGILTLAVELVGSR
jgi:hypothetical protein